METIDFLLARRSVVVKNMKEPGPSDEELEKILRVGIRVPDHGKIGPWRMQVIRDDGQQRLGDLYAEIFRRENPDADEEAIAVERQRPGRAPLLIAVTTKVNHEKAKVPPIEQKMSGGALCQNILLGASALGYAAQWITEWPAYHDEVKKALGHDPEDEIIGFIYIGTAIEPPAERARAEYQDVVSEWPGS